ncbi:uncharacterized protein LOC116261940 [Nymphaea colorata]|nr:uncharacterized protein LOC116261940 [Nymphaea colorata]
MEDEIPGATRRSGNSSAIRFLGILKQPDPDSCALELEESDVVWSRDFSDTSVYRPSGESSPTFENGNHNSGSSPASLSPASSGGGRRVQAFKQERSGLSAALVGENRSFVQRKAALDPLLSAARNIPPPVPVPRSGSGSDDFSGSGGGSSGKYHQSAPVNVPVWSRANNRPVNPPNFDEDDDETDEEMLPPHLLVARASARSHMTTFSVFEGVGRTLKGRDLRRVRNAVFQKTGFLD